MKIKLSTLIALVAFSSISMTAHAITRITEVTNDYQATNGCTVGSVYGYSGYNFIVSIYRVDCANDTVYTQKKVEGTGCDMTSETDGYFVSGPCGDYRIYKE
jgi:hypothetical protein